MASGRSTQRWTTERTGGPSLLNRLPRAGDTLGAPRPFPFWLVVAALVLGVTAAIAASTLSSHAELTPAEPRVRPRHIATLGPVERPAGIAVDGTGAVYVVDSARGRVNVFAPDGRPIRTIGVLAENAGSAAGPLTAPLGVAVRPDGAVWISDPPTGRILRFSATGRYDDALDAARWGGGRPGVLYAHGDLVYVCDLATHEVVAIDANGDPVQRYSVPDAGMSYPNGVWLAEDRSVFVSDTNNDRILHFDAGGDLLSATSVALSNPRGIGGGPGGVLFVASTLDQRVSVLEPDGTVREQLSTASGVPLGFPTGLAVSAGKLFVTDRAARAVQVWRIDE